MSNENVIDGEWLESIGFRRCFTPGGHKYWQYGLWTFYKRMEFCAVPLPHIQNRYQLVAAMRAVAGNNLLPSQLPSYEPYAAAMTEQHIKLISQRVVPKSCKNLSEDERLDGTRQMIRDLERMATDDGCIAAAWALEFIKAVTFL